MQSFKRDETDKNSVGLRVNRQNGALMPHFEIVDKELRGEGSLVDVIRLRRPFVIVDEAFMLLELPFLVLMCRSRKVRS